MFRKKKLSKQKYFQEINL